MDPLERLSASWRDEARLYRRRGLEREALLAESFSEELEAAWRAFQIEELSTPEAAKCSGYSEAYLRELAREGRVPARRDGGEWRFPRCDLPKRPAERSPLRVVEEFAAEIRAAGS